MDLSLFESLFVRHRTAVWSKKKIPNLRCYDENTLN